MQCNLTYNKLNTTRAAFVLVLFNSTPTTISRGMSEWVQQKSKCIRNLLHDIALFPPLQFYRVFCFCFCFTPNTRQTKHCRIKKKQKHRTRTHWNSTNNKKNNNHTSNGTINSIIATHTLSYSMNSVEYENEHADK